ncbi:MAG: hypothetical protein FD167_2974 [bacterium]|nr:MAG: hypothetical protein FD167_2974 [bacterium]
MMVLFLILLPFQEKKSEKIQSTKYQGVRIILKGNFDKIPVHIQIDFGFGDIVTPKPNWIDYPQLLNFGIPHLQVYTPESLIAEKYHAIVYLGQYNTRVKDFYDIYLLAQNNTFNGEILSTAISATFHNRSTIIPDNIPLAFLQDFYQDKEKLNLWKAFLEKSNLVYIDFDQVTQLLVKFLMPLSLALSANKPFRLNWSSNAQWH